MFFLLATFIGLASAANPPPGGMPGGFQQGNASDPYYLGLLWNATAAVNQDKSLASSKAEWIPTKVTDVLQQVVNGMNYEITAQFQQSSCVKGVANPSPIKCTVVKNGPKPKVYKVSIYSQPWTGTFKVTGVQLIG